MSTAVPQDYFDTIYTEDDPFGYRDRWYEARKRMLLLASLPRRRFRRGWEIGCSNGETTAELSTRCDSLLATDLCMRAVALARTRVGDAPHVDIRQSVHPDQWPAGRFDLIVFAEVGYYLAPDALARMVRGFDAALTDDGVLVACHWLTPFAEALQDGEAVHGILDGSDDLTRTLRYRDGDVLLESWNRTGRSVAQLAGLR